MEVDEEDKTNAISTNKATNVISLSTNEFDGTTRPGNSEIETYNAYRKATAKTSSGIYCYDCWICIKNLIFPQYFKSEFQSLMRLGWALSFNSFLVFFIPITMLLAVGQLGKEQLAGAGLGISFCNLTGMVFGVGFIAACDTLFSQAYGVGNFRRIGIVAQRALLISLLCLCPLVSLWINAEWILLALGQNPLVARLAAQFIECYVPALFLFILFNIIIRYLACQEIVYPSVFAALVATIVNGVCCYLFIHYFKLGVRGGAIAVDVSYLSLCLFLFTYIRCKLPEIKCWQGWSWECLGEWKQFLHLGISSIMMVTSKWWCFEIGIFAIGMISATEQATQIILFHIAELVYFISYGLSMATAVRMGHLLGRGDINQAKRALKVSLISISILTTMIGMFIVILKDVIPYIFTKDRSILHLTSQTISIVGLVEILDGIMAVLSGGVRGVGLQKYGAGINFVGYVLVGTLCLIVLIFVAKLGVLGFWTAIIISLVVQVLWFSILLYKANWRKLREKAKKKGGVYQDIVSYDVLRNEVKLKKTTALGYRSDERHAFCATVDSPNCIPDDDDATSNPEHIPEEQISAESNDNFFLSKERNFSLVSILPKIITALCSLSILLIGIFIRIFL